LPDLNPIEHTWKALKELYYKMFPKVINVKGDLEEDRSNLKEALKEAWLALSNSLFKSLVESIPRRIKACIKANRWYTKY
jgi:transposase